MVKWMDFTSANGPERRRCYVFLEQQELYSALFSCFKVPKKFQDSPSHRIFGRMYEVLNIDKK
jgi:hypothetical protein